MTQQINAEVYVMLRVYIDAGADLVRLRADQAAKGCDGCFPAGIEDDESLTLVDWAAEFYQYVPSAGVSLAPAQKMADEIAEGTPQNRPPVVRVGWGTFADRLQLIAALDAATPQEVREQIGSLEGAPAGDASEGWTGAAGDGVGWWAVALSAVGVLAWLGRRTVWGFLVSVGATAVLKFLVKAGAVTALGLAALKVVDATTEAITKTASGIPYLAIGAGVVAVIGLGVGVYVAARRRR